MKPVNLNKTVNVQLARISFRASFLTLPEPRRVPDPETESDFFEPTRFRNPSEVLWQFRDFWQTRFEEQLAVHLKDIFKGQVSARIERLERGSLTGLIVLTFVGGITFAEAISRYKDFYEGVYLLRAHVKDLIASVSKDVYEQTIGGKNLAVNATTNMDYIYTPPGGQRLKRSLVISRIRNALRWFLVVLAALYFLTQVSFVRLIVSYFWPIPELEHQVIFLRGKAGDKPHQAVFVLENTGFGPADNVFVQVRLDNNAILAYDIQSEEHYQVTDSLLEKGEITLWFDRFSMDMLTKMILVSGLPLSQNNIVYTAVSDQGRSSQRPFREVRFDLDDSAAALHPEWWIWFETLWQDGIRPDLMSNPWGAWLIKVIDTPVVWQVFSILLVAVFVTWLFISGRLAVIGLFGGLWLFFLWILKAQVPGSWLVVSGWFFLMIWILEDDLLDPILREVINIFEFKPSLDFDTMLKYLSLALIIIPVVFSVIYVWQNTFSIHWVTAFVALSLWLLARNGLMRAGII